MTNAYVVTGTLNDGTTITLDETLPAVGGKVRVTVEVVGSPPVSSFHDVMRQIWDDQRRRGHVPRSAEEIQAQIRAERDSWGD